MQSFLQWKQKILILFWCYDDMNLKCSFRDNLWWWGSPWTGTVLMKQQLCFESFLDEFLTFWAATTIASQKKLISATFTNKLILSVRAERELDWSIESFASHLRLLFTNAAPIHLSTSYSIISPYSSTISSFRVQTLIHSYCIWFHCYCWYIAWTQTR